MRKMVYTGSAICDSCYKRKFGVAPKAGSWHSNSKCIVCGHGWTVRTTTEPEDKVDGVIRESFRKASDEEIAYNRG